VKFADLTSQQRDMIAFFLAQYNTGNA